MITQIGPEYIDMVWPKFLPWVERALRHGQGDSLAPCDVLAALKSGMWNFWLIHEGEDLKAGMVLQLCEHPQKRVVFVVMLVGDMSDEWADELEETLLEYKELNNADCIECSCRPGLVKKLKNRGWRTKATIMELA